MLDKDIDINIHNLRLGNTFLDNRPEDQVYKKIRFHQNWKIYASRDIIKKVKRWS